MRLISCSIDISTTDKNFKSVLKARESMKMIEDDYD